MKMRATFTFDPRTVSIKEVEDALAPLKVDPVKFNMSVDRPAKATATK